MSYLNITNRFSVHRDGRREEYVGSVFASEEALFLHFTRTSAGALLALFTGLVAAPGFGRRFASWAERSSELLRPSRAMALDELPGAMTDDEEWPLRSHEGAIVVLPRGAPVEIRPHRYRGLRVHVQGEEFRISLSLFTFEETVRGLRELGWEV